MRETLTVSAYLMVLISVHMPYLICRSMRVHMSQNIWTEYISLAFRPWASVSWEDLPLLLSHAAPRGPQSPPGVRRRVPHQLRCHPRGWHAHPVGSDGRPGDRPAHTERSSDPRPLELPPPHESLPADHRCHRPIEWLHGHNSHWRCHLGTAAAVRMDANIRYLERIYFKLFLCFPFQKVDSGSFWSSNIQI